MSRRQFTSLMVLLSLVLVPLCRADDVENETLKSKNLSKSAGTFVLPGEIEVLDGMKATSFEQDQGRCRAAQCAGL